MTIAQNVIHQQDEYDVSLAKCDIIAHFVSRANAFPCDTVEISDYTVNLLQICSRHDSNEAVASLLSSILHIPIAKAELNSITFPAMLEDKLDISRKLRQNLTLDTNLWIYMTARYELTPLHRKILSRAEFDNWFTTAYTALTSERVRIATLLRRDIPSQLPRAVSNAVKFYRGLATTDLRWQKQKKRKRTFAGSPITALCGICFDDKLVDTTGCGHTFCKECLSMWLEDSCPTCRQSLIQHYKSRKKTSV